MVLIFAGLAALPLVLPADTIRTELAARLAAATGREIRIDGPVSLRVIPTARLSAEGVGIGGLGGETEDFSVESVSFGLSLLPLVTGNVEISGVTITRPVVLVETDANGGTNWTAAADPSGPASIEDMIAGEAGAANGAPGGNSAPQDTLAVLDRLSIGRVTIADGSLLWRDASSGREERLDNIDLDVRVPRLDSAGTIAGSFTYLGVAQSFDLELGERPDPSRFETIPINLTLSSEAGTVVSAGTAMDGETLFNGSIEAEGKSLAAFAKGFGIDLPAMPVFGAFSVASRLIASTSQVRIDEFGIDLGGLEARGGAVIGLDRARPGVGLKIAAETVDTALFVAEAGSDAESSSDGGAGTPASAAAGSEEIDFSTLSMVDANIDLSAKQILVGSVPVTDFGVDVQIVNGGLNATIRSATVNGAPASGTIAVDGGADVPTIEGSVKVDGLDAAGVAALSGMDFAVEGGAVGADVSFATRGNTQDALIVNLDGSGRVSIADGRIGGLGVAEYVGGDAAADEIANVGLSAEFTSLSAPIDANGGFDWRGERFTVAGSGDLRAFASDGTTPVSLKASSQRVNFGFNGEAGLAGLGSGTVNLSTPSLRNLLAWVGQPIEPGGGLGAFSIDGAVALEQDAFSFDKADFTLDGSSGVGTGKLTFGGKPKITAGLSMKRLDVTPYMLASGTASGGGAAGGAAPAPSGNAGGGAWSSAPLGFDGLRAIDANLNLKADEIIADQVKIGPSLMTATITDGKLTAKLTEMALYSGIGVGTLLIDGSSQTPSVEAFFRLDQVDALPFLSDAAGFSWVEGTASFSFDIRSSGGSQAALMAALNGKGAMDFRDGAIRGIDIPNMVRNLSIETLLGWGQSGDEKTEFSQLAGTYTIENGILTNRDLVLVGPLLRVTGAGTVDIPKQTLSYRVDPKIVASLEGQGGSEDLEGFAVPVRVEGSWSRPRIYPEIEGILQNPQAALDQLRKLGDGLFGGGGSAAPQADRAGGKSVEDRINEEISKGLGKLFGGSGSGDSPPQPAAPQQPAAEAQQPSPEVAAPPARPPQAEAPTSQEAAAPPADQPVPDQQPAAQTPPASPLDALQGQPPTGGTVQGEGQPEAAEGPQEGAETGEQPTTPDQPIDLLKSLLGQ